MSHPARQFVSMKNQGPFEALGFKWFEKNQSRLLWALNNKYVKRIFRWILRISGDLAIDENIDLIKPNCYRVPLGPIKIKGKWMNGYRWDFRTHMKFSKRMYYAFRPVWWGMHFWDWAIADRFIPQLSFGFDTLTAYPDAHPETNTVDGYIANEPASTPWSTVRNASTGTSANDTDAFSQRPSVLWNSGNASIGRVMALFDTSSLGSGAVIASATYSQMHAQSFVNNSFSTDIACCSSSPASNTALVTGDYDQFGTTVFARVSLTGFPSLNNYADWSLNASGEANIAKTGISKFGLRIGLDIDDNEPASNGAADPGGLYFADQSGTTKDPKLVVITGTDYTQVVTDTISATSSVVKSTTRTLSESVTATASVAKSLVRTIIDTITSTASLVAQKIKTLVVTDTVTATDTIARSITKVITDTVTAATSRVVLMTRAITDTISTATSALRTIGRAFLDSVSASDSAAKTTARSVTDSVSASDSVVRSVVKVVSDAVTATTSVVKKPIKVALNFVTARASTFLIEVILNNSIIDLIWTKRSKPTSIWTKRTKPDAPDWQERDLP